MQHSFTTPRERGDLGGGAKTAAKTCNCFLLAKKMIIHQVAASISDSAFFRFTLVLVPLSSVQCLV